MSFWHDIVNIVRFREYNWCNFRLIGFDMEWDKMDNSFNLEIALLGFNMLWQVALSGDTKQSKELGRSIKEIDKTLHNQKGDK